jgi:hypothetical protein
MYHVSYDYKCEHVFVPILTRRASEGRWPGPAPNAQPDPALRRVPPRWRVGLGWDPAAPGVASTRRSLFAQAFPCWRVDRVGSTMPDVEK